ncbi:Chitinase-like protein EN03 [Gryllus bimaculatus]|nr:Chitinase-like protein EN03 [Gryllus bimaculatus]
MEMKTNVRDSESEDKENGQRERLVIMMSNGDGQEIEYVEALSSSRCRTAPALDKSCHAPESSWCFLKTTSAAPGIRPGRMIPSDIDPVLSYCTHLIYGYAKIDSHQKIAALDESLDLSSGKDNYRAITALKKRFPQVKFLLSVGGGADLDDADKYNKILEDSSNRAQFVHSVKAFLKRNDFDGLDLSWQLPEIYKKKDRGTFGSIWHGVKKTFGYAHSHKDEKADEHREGFTKLVQDLRKELRDDNLLLTATVLSNVNASLYFEADKLAKEIDQIHLKAFDFKSPQKDPNEADYSAALFPSEQRDPFFTVDGQVRSFIARGFPSNKIILGIPTYAVTWKLTSESKISGVPPIQAEGPGEEGPQTKSPGRLSYAEVCSLIDNPINKGNNKHLLRRVNDPAKKSGSYGFRLPDGDSIEGLWASFTDPDTAGDKAAYAKAKSLGGIAFWDISLDDFRGVCNGVKYPIIHTAKNRLV